eukprot:CAMPEP_0172718898 /NCGR_PEP_ID=MMETSP1074-20121228/75191_1 /TAXON_ID=2916 /ORGANISM="Ceratium fusus, Strain PA161109" /LENGTH=77 /DNA_ID=CAMNT_0013544187 /DNA_START=355 /DNA_END=588 /DNA_ORIENTATION=+
MAANCIEWQSHNPVGVAFRPRKVGQHQLPKANGKAMIAQIDEQIKTHCALTNSLTGITASPQLPLLGSHAASSDTYD